MEYREIGKTGLKVSRLSYGASSLGSVFHETDDRVAIKAVHTAVERGMNFIDVSPYYGHYKAETVLGKALKDLDRSDYYLSTRWGVMARMVSIRGIIPPNVPRIVCMRAWSVLALII